MLAWVPLLIFTGTVAESHDLNTAFFRWGASLVDPTHDAPTGYRVKVGTISGGPYPLIREVTGTPLATTLAVNQVISTPGGYYSVLTALGTHGESAPSAQIHFTVGYAPNSPSGYSIIFTT